MALTYDILGYFSKNNVRDDFQTTAAAPLHGPSSSTVEPAAPLPSAQTRAHLRHLPQMKSSDNPFILLCYFPLMQHCNCACLTLAQCAFIFEMPDLDKDQSLAAGPGPLHLYLLLLDPVLNLFGGRLVRSEQADGAGELRVQYVSIFVSDHQIEIQVPCIKTGESYREAELAKRTQRTR